MAYDQNVKTLVKLRLMAMPADVALSIGSFGDFTSDKLIKEVEDETPVGQATVDMELLFIRKMATLSERMARAKAKSA
ncbi:MAG TPA: hypothetical protein VJB16_00250 [archaeon]|nr:hypothetical protein [archaeon]